MLAKLQAFILEDHAMGSSLLPEGPETWDFKCAMLRSAHCYYKKAPGFPQALFSSLPRAVTLSKGADCCPDLVGSVLENGCYQ